MRALVESIDTPGHRPEKSKSSSPIHTVQNHGRTEGFALDWSPPSTSTSVRLLSGDLQGRIYLTTLGTAGFSTAPQPFSSHTQAVEGLQWSPSEATVFASCSSDQSVRVWDVRVKTRKNVVGIMKAHDSDVNVITWNKGTTYLLASGGDEGVIKIWDLRNLKGYDPCFPLRLGINKVTSGHHLQLHHLSPLSIGTPQQSRQSNGIPLKTRSLQPQGLMTRSHCGICPLNRMRTRLERRRCCPQLGKGSRTSHRSCSSFTKVRRISRRFTGTRKYRDV